MRALGDYAGAVLLITHDPHLVDLVADRLWLVADGTVRAFEGDLDEYRALLVERARPQRAEAAPSRADDRRARAEAREAVAPLRRRVRDAEARITKLGAERTAIEARLADPALYSQGRASDLTAANMQLAAIARDLAAAETDWLEAEEALAQASQVN